MASTPTQPQGLRIVIPVVAGIGNALLAVPMIRQLKRKLPTARITVIARIAPMADVFHRLDEIDEVLITGKGVEAIIRNVAWSRSRRADAYLVPFPSNRWQYSLLALASGAKKKVLHSYPVGYWRAMHFIGDRISAERGIHDVQQNLNLLKLLDIDPDPAEAPTFPLTEAERATAAPRLGGITNPIVIHAGSAQTVLAQAKRWPPASYRALLEQLQRDREVILIEGPDEAGVAAQISPSARTIKLTGPLGEAAALLERAALYVGSDSGLAHLAAAVGTPAVTLFAPADPDRVCPFGYRELVVQPPMPCTPCAQYPWHTPYPKILCREPMCIAKITVEMVMEKVRRAMEMRRSTPPLQPAATT